MKPLTFNQGWRDHLWRQAYPDAYERAKTRDAVTYERGRHAAALYEFECRRLERTINAQVTFAQARRGMGLELRRMIEAERKWCALRIRPSLAQRLTSKGKT